MSLPSVECKGSYRFSYIKMHLNGVRKKNVYELLYHNML